MNEARTTRPLVLEMDDTKRELIKIINEAIQVKGIPCFLVEYILSDVAYQVHNGANEEREVARKQIQSKEGA